MRYSTISFFLLSLGLFSTPAPANPPGPEHQLLLAHYMPWFQSKVFGGEWGYHWRMKSFDPDYFDGPGRRQIASHYYPLIGPYDSADPDLVEYHVLLMKLAGIDGVIADWYGHEKRLDYGAIDAATVVLFKEIERRHMRFAITYEDRIFASMPIDDASRRARDDFNYANITFFNSTAYVKLAKRPVVLLFGPAFFDQAVQWDRLFSGLPCRPDTFTLHDGGPADAGGFAWPPMFLAKDGVVKPSVLDAFFAKYDSGNQIPGATVGFRDIYEKAGVRTGYGIIDPERGETFRRTLRSAIHSAQPVVQLITWNDFGEGTMIEPTSEFAFQFLDTIHREHAAGAFDEAAGRAAVRIYETRKSRLAVKYKVALDAIVDHFHAGQDAQAIAALNALLSTGTDKSPK